MIFKASVVGLMQPTPQKQSSHTYGWARTWADRLSVPINHKNESTEVMFIDHGVNFGGGLNMFGGYKEELGKRILTAAKSSEFWSLDIPMPDYASMLANRKDFKDRSDAKKILKALETIQENAKTLHQTNLRFNHLVIGDSHTASWAPRNSMVVKTNGKTLFGQLQSEFEYVFTNIQACYNQGVQLEKLTLVFGNIDVRHHILRHNADWRQMWRGLKKFGDSTGLEVQYSVPWPIEHEERKIPKTGFYKDAPFYGSQAERSQLVHDIRHFMQDEGMWPENPYPDSWFDMTPDEFATNCMEKPQSVHLSPECYVSSGYYGWGRHYG